MRLIEEKNLLKLNIISVVLIVLTTFLILVSDHFLKEENDKIMVQLLLLNQKEQFKINHDIKSRFYTLYLSLGITAHNTENTESSLENLKNSDKLGITEERSNLRRDFLQGRLSREEYTSGLIDFHRQQSEKFRREYNEILKQIQKQEPSSWLLLKKVCFVLQLIGIATLIIGYSKLISLISNRVSARKI